MSIRDVHPLYTLTLADQELMKVSYAGERAVKEKGVTYLKPTAAMVIDGMNKSTDIGAVAYDGYKLRAVYPDLVSDTTETLLGLLHQNPATIELPTVMEYMLEKATSDGEGLQGLLRRINEQQLVSGRLGLMLDLPKQVDPANPMPFIAMYDSLSIRNWDDSDDHIDVNKLQFVVLDESGLRREGLTWVRNDKYRLLALGTFFEQGSGDLEGKYTYSVYDEKGDPRSGQYVTPTIRGKSLDVIPFVFINSKDTKASPDNPPLLPIANAAMHIYRSEADYRQNLYMQGQDTLVVIGTVKTMWDENNQQEQALRVGAGARIDVDMGGDAKYVGVGADGLSEQRTALENDYNRIKGKTGELIDTMGSKQESGEALKTRMGAQTATLNQIADTAAKALSDLLKICATWMGANPDDVKVTPNKEFVDQTISGRDLLDLTQAKNQGAPLSKKTLHAIAAERGLTKMTFDEEMDEINDEDPLLGTTAGALAALAPPVDPNKQPAPAPDTPPPAPSPAPAKPGAK